MVTKISRLIPAAVTVHFVTRSCRQGVPQLAGIIGVDEACVYAKQTNAKFNFGARRSVKGVTAGNEDAVSLGDCFRYLTGQRLNTIH